MTKERSQQQNKHKRAHLKAVQGFHERVGGGVMQLQVQGRRPHPGSRHLVLP